MADNDTLNRPKALDGNLPDPFAGLSDVIDDILSGRNVGQPKPAAPAPLQDELSFFDAELDAIDTGFLAPARSLSVAKPLRLDGALAAQPAAVELTKLPDTDSLSVGASAMDLPRPEEPVGTASLRGALPADFAPVAPGVGLAASVRALFASRPVTAPPAASSVLAEQFVSEVPVAVEPPAPAPVISRPIPAPVRSLDDSLVEALSANGAPYDETPATEAINIPAMPVQAVEAPPAVIDDELDFYEIVRTRAPHQPSRLSTAASPVAVTEPALGAMVARAPEDTRFEPQASVAVPSGAKLQEKPEPAVSAPTTSSGVSFDDFAAYFDEHASVSASSASAPIDPLAAQPNTYFEPFEEAAAPVVATPPPRSRRSSYVAAGVLGIALVGGAAAFFGGNSVLDGTSETPTIVRADPEPVRVAPQDPGGTQVANQDSVVLNEVAGGQSPLQPMPAQPELVEGREEPIISGAPVKVEERVPGTGNTDAEEPALAVAVPPRQVQTVTVRPDGTIVTEPAAPVPAPEPIVSPAPVAEAAPAPAPEPAPAAADAAPAAPPVVPDQQSAALPETGPTPAPAPEPAPVAEPEPVAAAPVPAPSPDPGVVPDSRPVDQPLNIVNDAPQPEAPAQPQAEVAAAAQPGGFAMQISSQPSEAAAVKSLQDLGRRFGSILGGRDYAIQKAEVPGKGTFYRVRILVSSREEANQLCGQYKAAGGSCFVTR